MEPQFRDIIEWEATLAICSDVPDAVVHKIIDISYVDAFRLVSGPTILIRDTYFDTDNGALASTKWALRLRQIADHQWIALKGPARRADAGGVRRLELELPWSLGALEQVRDELCAHEVICGPRADISDAADAWEVLRTLGFRIIQSRDTSRQLRDVFSPQGERAAEIALDTVTYCVEGRKILHEEIEVEAKAPDGSRALTAILERLMREFGPYLRRWDFGKLATGLAVERILKEGPTEGLISPDGHLTPDAYNRLERLLR